MSQLDELADALVELDEETTLAIARDLVAKGDTPSLSILNVCQQAMRVVGERYERHEYYLEALIISGEIFQEVIALIQPNEDRSPSEGQEGLVLLATVHGDIHDIGKNLFASSLRGFGFRVIDLGVDVPPKTIVDAVRAHHPDVVCLSGLITAAFQSMRTTTLLLRECSRELGYNPPVVLGGSTVDDQVCRFAGADSWSNDAMEGVRICRRLAGQTRGNPIPPA
jgi:methanogenic corrinoid protein MtbC1